MSEPGQPPRRYASEVRDEQARRTRRAIVAAAHDLFLAEGYAATTIDAIAAAAHVSRRTVFNSVGGKAALLKLAWTGRSPATTNRSRWRNARRSRRSRPHPTRGGRLTCGRR